MGYAKLYDSWKSNPEAFWMKAAEAINWDKAPSFALNDTKAPLYEWYTDAMVNTCFNAVDRHVNAGRGEQAAIIYDSPITNTKQHISFAELLEKTANLAGALRAQGIQKGDRVIIYMPMVPDALVAMLACARIGAIHSVVFGGFAANELAVRIDDAKPKAILAASCGIEPGRVISYKPLIDSAIEQSDHKPQTVIILQRPELQADLIKGRDLDWYEAQHDVAPASCVAVEGNHPAYILYTSGTTGEPKGTLYSHRSTVLHAMMLAISLPNALKEGKKILPVVPLFHVNAWGLPYAAPLTGAGLVFPGPKLDGDSLFNLMETEKVYSAWGVPTVWLNLLQTISRKQRPPVGFGDVVIGGASAPRAMIEDFEKLNINVCHAWGMTEMSPVGTQGNIPYKLKDISLQDKLDIKAKHGRRLFGVELKIVNDQGTILTHDGISQGDLYVRGHAITAGYFNNAEATREAFDTDGWFSTGDIATIDCDGFLTIVDRSKDLIKSGGEWISSLDIENIAISHPHIANCTAIAAPHPKWGERPILIVIPANGITPDKNSIQNLLSKHFAKWQIPDDIIFTEILPLTATGKVSKLTLRNMYKNHFLIKDTK